MTHRDHPANAPGACRSRGQFERDHAASWTTPASNSSGAGAVTFTTPKAPSTQQTQFVMAPRTGPGAFEGWARQKAGGLRWILMGSFSLGATVLGRSRHSCAAFDSSRGEPLMRVWMTAPLRLARSGAPSWAAGRQSQRQPRSAWAWRPGRNS